MDTEFTNYKCGIDISYSGVKGTAYMEEYLYSNKLICDRKVTYIQGNTLIDLSSNDRNVIFLLSGNASSVIVGTGGTGVGLIRYRIDRDLQWQYQFGTGGGHTTTLAPAYTGPFAFSGLNYQIGMPVIGNTGSTGGILNTTTQINYFWRGMGDSFGDEWHILTVAHDDSAVPGIATGTSSAAETWCSDGRVNYFVVNPKTPAMTIRASGGAEFYTTPPKKYFIPQIYNQTTYFSTNTGTLTFELKALSGQSVIYRINSGVWNTGTNPVLTDASFSNGNNVLDYYYSGNSAFTKVRNFVKNPTHPSLSETHGTTYVGEGGWTRILTNLEKSGVVNGWCDTFQNNSFFNKHSVMDSKILKGYRPGELGNGGAYNTNSPDAIMSIRSGWNTPAIQGTGTCGWYAKVSLLDNPTSIDSVGLQEDNSFTSIATRETIYRGYYDIVPIIDLALTYDLIAAYYRSDQYSGGLTPIEDYYVRDCLARSIQEQIFMTNMSGPGNYSTGGMWDTARCCGALFAMFALPSYSTPYFGTCGLDGNTGALIWNPFPSGQYTWKQVLLDNNLNLDSFPYINKRLGIEEYLFNASGNFTNNFGYQEMINMGRVLFAPVNAVKIAAPAYGNSYPRYEKSLVLGALGDLTGTQDGGTGYTLIPPTINNRFPASAALSLTYAHANSSLYNNLMLYTFGLGMMWVDDPLYNTLVLKRLGAHPKFVVYSS